MSLAEQMGLLPAEERDSVLADLTDIQLGALAHDWGFWGRPSQQTPIGDKWLTWLILAGRGWGKTRTGAEFIVERALSLPGSRGALVGANIGEVRDTMVEGESGLLSVVTPDMLRGGSVFGAWNRSLNELFFANGSHVKGFSAEESGQLRGPQHHYAWADEIAKWRDAASGVEEDTAWSNLMFGLRLGEVPQCVATTTPKPYKLIRDLLADPMTVHTKGTTYDNLQNLAPAFALTILRRYEGTSLGRQELEAELLDDVEGALWTRALLDATRVKVMPQLVRVLVGVDPSVTSKTTSAECGIVTVGKGVDGHAYVFADDSLRASPNDWAEAAVQAYDEAEADKVVAEVNNGGDLVETVVRTIDPGINYESVHATRGKLTRAEPVAALFEQNRMHIVGRLPALEDQLCCYVPGETSPDRMDAMVWAATKLLLGKGSWLDYYAKGA